MNVHVLIPLTLAVALTASMGASVAQTGPRTNDPHAVPQGPDAPRRADTQSAGVAAQAEARAECREEDRRERRRDCVREARRDFDRDKAGSAPMPTRPTIQPQ